MTRSPTLLMTLLLVSSTLTGIACQGTTDSTESKLNNTATDQRVVLRSVHSNLCLDIPHGRFDRGAAVTQYRCNGASAQVFILRKKGEFSQILTSDGRMALDIPNGSKEPGQWVQLWDAHGGDPQLFALDSDANGSTVIRSKTSGLVFDVDKLSKSNGARVLQWTQTGANNQKWFIEPVDTYLGTTDDSQWNLVWADEFDGSTIDSSKWNFEVKHPGWVNNELQNYTNDRRENARLERGKLVIEARTDNFGGHPISSARLKTEGKASWTYGRFEARIKVPGGLGTWPAFWMMPDDQTGGWPDCGEIDIMEHVGYDPEIVHATTHSKAYSWKSQTQRTASTHVPGMTDGFHTFAVEWHPDRIDAFVDGRKYYTSLNEGTGHDAYPFTKNFHLILNLAIGGDWGGSRGVDTQFGSRKMLVDYVRVYKKR